MNKPGFFQASGGSPPVLDVAHRLYEFMLTQSQPLTEQEIQKQVKGRRAYKLAALRLLLVDGTVIRSGEGKNKSPYLFQVLGTEPLKPPISTVDPTEPTKRSIKAARATVTITDCVVTGCHSLPNRQPAHNPNSILDLL
jgi:hypothetical protein